MEPVLDCFFSGWRSCEREGDTKWGPVISASEGETEERAEWRRGDILDGTTIAHFYCDCAFQRKSLSLS